MQQHSEFENSSNGSNAQQISSTDSTVAQITAALDLGDHETAGNLLREALDRAPDDSQLLRLVPKQRRQTERFTRVYSLLKETHEAIENDEFVRAVGAFREAANLSQGFPALEESTFQVGIDEAGQLGDRNWRIARTLLEDAARVNKRLVVPGHRWGATQAAEREETIANVLAETALAKPAALGRARERLLRTLEQYPDDLALLNRLKSIECTIEEKRKWDERQKCLKKLGELRDSMQREVDPAHAGKFVAQSETLAAAYIDEPEFKAILDDIKHQVISSQNAVTALKQDRIEDCLEECAWVLSRMRHHQMFLNLKKQAEERELSLVDEYSNAVSRIKALLAAGQLAEAAALCSRASAGLPQFADLQELKKEIEERRSKEDIQNQETAESARRLVDRGERSLRENQFRLAEQSFGNALKLLPEDKKLSANVIDLLHGYARSVVRDHAQAAEEVLQIAARLLPGTTLPVDLVDAVQKKRQQTKDEAARWSALSKIASLDAQVESSKKLADLSAIREDADKSAFTDASHADVKEAAAALFGKMDSRTAVLAAKQARRPAIYRTISIAATLLLGIGLAFWLNRNRPISPAPVKPQVVETAASPQIVPPAAPAANTDTPPQSFAVNDEEPTKPSRLEIRGVEPNTRIKLDGVLLGKAGTNKKVFTKDVTAGRHSIELSRSGFMPKTFTHNLEPGEKLVLRNRDLQLESSDARKSPNMTTSLDTETKVAELQWQSLDKNNTAALRAFVAQHPNSPWSSQAKQQIETVLLAREMKTEDNDWSSADHSSRAALEDFLKKHPGGRHAGAATSALAEIERRTRSLDTLSAEDAAWKKVNPHDEAALESYLRDSPNGRYRNQAEVSLATIRLSRTSASDKAAVLSVIARLANAWNARDLDSILALQRNLSKRVVKAELSNVKKLEMQISPASPPQIDGTQAVVLCRRQASQIFSDGTRKQVPESIVSYVLSKRDGNWIIEGTK